MLAIIKTIKKSHIEHKSHAIKYKNSPVDHHRFLCFFFFYILGFVLFFKFFLVWIVCWAVCLFLFAFNYNKFS